MKISKESLKHVFCIFGKLIFLNKNVLQFYLIFACVGKKEQCILFKTTVNLAVTDYW